jgi:hypothetical protein
MAETPNYHIRLWPEPPGPPTYLCLVPECGFEDATEAAVQVHVTSAHGLTAVPTPLAADPTLVGSLMLQENDRGADKPDVLDGSERE